MKKTALEKMFQYFIEQKNNGVSHWCINDLLGQLQQAKAMEKEEIESLLEKAIQERDYYYNLWKKANAYIVKK